MQREQALQKKMEATSPRSDDVSRKKARRAENLNLEGTSPPDQSLRVLLSRLCGLSL